MRSEASATQAQTAADVWIERVIAAKVEVIDPNSERLAEHMKQMKEEHMDTAANELTGSRLRTVIKAKALSAHKILMAAMDDVQARGDRAAIRSGRVGPHPCAGPGPNPGPNAHPNTDPNVHPQR